MSSNLTALVAALEAIDNQEHELTLRESEKHLRRAVRKFTLEQNESLPSSRKVSIFSTNEVVTRHINSNLNIDDPRDWMFGAAREVAHFMDYALTAAGKPLHQDLLPVGHPESKNPKLEGFTASGVRSAAARWYSDDARVDDSVRSVVFAALSSEPGTVENQFAIARMQAVTAGLIPSELIVKPLVAAFGIGNPFSGENSSIARAARAKMQRRDRKGRFAEMGGGARLFAILDGIVSSITGKFAGNPENSNDMEIEIKNHPTIPNGIYTASASRLEGIRAVLGDDALKNLNGRKGAFGPDQRKLAVPMADLLATRKDAPTGWNANGDGSFTSADGYNVTPDGNGGWDIKDENGALVGNSPDWANVQKMAAQSDVKSGKAPKPKARLDKKTADKVETEGFAQEPGKRADNKIEKEIVSQGGEDGGFAQDTPATQMTPKNILEEAKAFFEDQNRSNGDLMNPEGFREKAVMYRTGDDPELYANTEFIMNSADNPAAFVSVHYANGAWHVESGHSLDNEKSLLVSEEGSYKTLEEAFAAATDSELMFKAESDYDDQINSDVENALANEDPEELQELLNNDKYESRVDDLREAFDKASDKEYRAAEVEDAISSGDRDAIENYLGDANYEDDQDRLQEALDEIIANSDDNEGGFAQEPGDGFVRIPGPKNQTVDQVQGKLIESIAKQTGKPLQEILNDPDMQKTTNDIAKISLGKTDGEYDSLAREIAKNAGIDFPGASEGFVRVPGRTSMPEGLADHKFYGPDMEGNYVSPDGRIEIEADLLDVSDDDNRRPLQEILNVKVDGKNVDTITRNKDESDAQFKQRAADLAQTGIDNPNYAADKRADRDAAEAARKEKFNSPEEVANRAEAKRISDEKKAAKEEVRKAADTDGLLNRVDEFAKNVFDDRSTSYSEERGGDMEFVVNPTEDYDGRPVIDWTLLDDQGDVIAEGRANESFDEKDVASDIRDGINQYLDKKSGSEGGFNQAPGGSDNNIIPGEPSGPEDRVAQGYAFLDKEDSKPMYGGGEQTRWTANEDANGEVAEVIKQVSKDGVARYYANNSSYSRGDNSWNDVASEGPFDNALDAFESASSMRESESNGWNEDMASEWDGDNAGLAQAPGERKAARATTSVPRNQIKEGDLVYDPATNEVQRITRVYQNADGIQFNASSTKYPAFVGPRGDMVELLDDQSGQSDREILQTTGSRKFLKKAGDVKVGDTVLDPDTDAPLKVVSVRQSTRASYKGEAYDSPITTITFDDGTTRDFNSWRGNFALPGYLEAKAEEDSAGGLAQAPGGESVNADSLKVGDKVIDSQGNVAEVVKDGTTDIGGTPAINLKAADGRQYIDDVPEDGLISKASPDAPISPSAVSKMAAKEPVSYGALGAYGDGSVDITEENGKWKVEAWLFGLDRNGDNAEYSRSETFDTLEQAQAFADEQADKIDGTPETDIFTEEEQNRAAGFDQAPGGGMSDAATPAQYDFVKNVLDKQGSKLPVELRDAMEETLANRSATKGDIGKIIGEMNKVIDPNVPSDRQLNSIRRGLVSKGLPAKEVADITKRLPTMTKGEASDLITRLKGMEDSNGWTDASPHLMKKNSEGLDIRYTPKGDGTWDATPVSEQGDELGASENFKTLAAAEDAVDGINVADLRGQDDVGGFAQEPGGPTRPTLSDDIASPKNWKLDSRNTETYESEDGRIKVTFEPDADVDDEGRGIDLSYFDVFVDGEKVGSVNAPTARQYEFRGENEMPEYLVDAEDYIEEIQSVIDGDGQGFEQRAGEGFAQQSATNPDFLEEDPNALELKSPNQKEWDDYKSGNLNYTDANGNMSTIKSGISKDESGRESRDWRATYSNPANRNGTGTSTSQSFDNPEAAEKWLRKQIADGNKEQNKEKSGGFSAKQMEPATPAQYDMIQEHLDEREFDATTSQAITEALANRNLTKAQMSTLIGQGQAAPFKPGVDPTKPSDRLINSLNAKLLTKDISDEERKDILDRIPGMKRDEMEALNNKLRSKKDIPGTAGFAQEAGSDGSEKELFTRFIEGGKPLNEYTEDDPAYDRIQEILEANDVYLENLAETDPGAYFYAVADMANDRNFSASEMLDVIEKPYRWHDEVADNLVRGKWADEDSAASYVDLIERTKAEVEYKKAKAGGFAQEPGEPTDSDQYNAAQAEFDQQMSLEPISRSNRFPGGLRDERTGRVNSPEYIAPDEARINDLADRLDAVLKDADFNLFQYSSGKELKDDLNDSRYTDVGIKFQQAESLRDLANELDRKGGDQQLVADLREAADDIIASETFKSPLKAALYDSDGSSVDLYSAGEMANNIRKAYFETDSEELVDNIFFNGDFYGDVRSGGVEGRVFETEDGKYEADYSLPDGNGVEETQTFDDRDEAVSWLAMNISKYNSSLVPSSFVGKDSYSSDLDLESELDDAEKNGTGAEFAERIRDLAGDIYDARGGDRSVASGLEDFADRAEANLGSAGKEGGFAQEAGTATPSPKMGEPATDAQYDYLKELANSKQGITPEMAAAIQDALSSKNLTKSQVGAFLGQLRAMENRTGVDPTKPTPRQVKRAKDLANSLGLSPTEKRALGLNRLTSMSSDEIQKLIDNLKRRGGDQGGSGGVRPKAPSGDKPGGGAAGQVPGKLISQTPRSKFLEGERADQPEIIDRVQKNLDSYATQDPKIAKLVESFKKKYPEGIYSMIDIAMDPKSTQGQIDKVTKDALDLAQALEASPLKDKTPDDGTPNIYKADTFVLNWFAKYGFGERTPEINEKKMGKVYKKHSDGTTPDAKFSATYNPNLEEYKSSQPGVESAIGYVSLDALQDMAGNEVRSDYVVDAIAKDLKDGVGFKEPIILIYDPKTGRSFVTEGNHRVQAARKAGVKYVPVRVVNLQNSPGDVSKMNDLGKGLGTRPIPDGVDEWPADIQPKDIFPAGDLLPESSEGFSQKAAGPASFNDLKSAIGSSTTDTADGGEYDWPTSEGFAQNPAGGKRNRVLEALAIASTIMSLFDDKPSARKGKENVDTAGMFANDLRYVKDDLAKALDKFKNPKKGMDKFDAIVEFAKAVGDAGVAFRRAKSRWDRNNPQKPKAARAEAPKILAKELPAKLPEGQLIMPFNRKYDWSLNDTVLMVNPGDPMYEDARKWNLEREINLLGETFNISTTPPKGLPGTPPDYVHSDGTQVWLISPDMQEKLDAMDRDSRDLPYAGFAQEPGNPKDELPEEQGAERVYSGMVGDKPFKDKNGKEVQPGDEDFYADIDEYASMVSGDDGLEALMAVQGEYYADGSPVHGDAKKLPMQYTGVSLADITGKKEDEGKYIFRIDRITEIPKRNDDGEDIDANEMTEDEYYEEYGNTDGWEPETSEFDEMYVVINSAEFDSTKPTEIGGYDGSEHEPLDSLSVKYTDIAEFEKKDTPGKRQRDAAAVRRSEWFAARREAEEKNREERKENFESSSKDGSVTVGDLTLEKGDSINLPVSVSRDKFPDGRDDYPNEDGSNKLEFQGVTLADFTGRPEDNNIGLYKSDLRIYWTEDYNYDGESESEFDNRTEGTDEEGGWEPETTDAVSPGYYFISAADFERGGLDFDKFASKRAPAEDIGDLVRSTSEETDAVRDYTRQDAKGLNRRLRNGEKLSPDEEKRVKNLDSVIAKSKVKNRIDVSRGVFFADGKTVGTDDNTADYEKLQKLLVEGNEFVDPSFVSTAENYDNIAVFSNPRHVLTGERVSGRGFTYFIEIPEGSNAYKVGSGISKYNESEVLLPRNTKYKVTSVDRDANGNIQSVNLKVLETPSDISGFAQAPGSDSPLAIDPQSFNNPASLEGPLKASKWNDRDGGEFDWPTGGFTQRASKSQKRNRIKDAMDAADEALGKLGNTTGQKRIKAVGAFAKDMGKVGDDLGKAVGEFKNPNDGVSKFDAILNFAKALIEAKSALDRVRSRWDRADSKRKPSRSKAKPKVNTKRIDEASRFIEDAATPLYPATVILPGTSGFPKIPDQGMRPIVAPEDFSPRVRPTDRLIRDPRISADLIVPPKFRDVQRDLLVGPNNTSPTAPKTVEEAVSQNAKAEADLLKSIKERLAAGKGRAHMWARGYKLERGSDRFSDRVTEDNLPINPASGHVYSAGNMYLLAEAAGERGYSDRRWMTYTQAANMGATVREGEQGVQILAPTRTQLADGSVVTTMKPTWVFNAEQMDNVGPDTAPKASGMDAGEALDFVLMRFNEAERLRGREGLDIKERRARDATIDAPRWVDPTASRAERLTMPDRSQYDSPAGYLQTLLHELTHAVGHQSRLARESNVKALEGKGSSDQRQLAMEELTAELGSAVLMRRLGVPFDSDMHAEYVKSWMDSAKLSEADLNKAFTEAQLAADYVLGNDVLPKWDNITTDYEKAPKGFRPNAGRTWNPDPKFGPDEAAPAVPAGTPGSEENPEIVGFAQAAASSRDGKKVVKDSQSAMDKVTAQIIDSLKDGKLPWRKPFKGIAGANMQRNPASKRIYTGFNQQILAIIQAERGYNDPRWMTYNQAQGMGGQVRKGEKGVFILVPMRMSKEDAVTGEDKSFVMFKAVAVFNAEQIDGLNLPTLESEAEGKQMAPLDAHEFVVERYKKAMEARTGTPVDITYRDMSNTESPHWSPTTDKIVLPSQKQFNSPEDMFDTMAHEMVHSTGHGSRLDRTDLTKDYGNADGVARAKEELIAEIGAATIADMFGVETTLDNSTAYVRSWLERLQNHPEEVIQASREAQKAVDYLLGIDIGDWSPLNGYGPGNAVDTDNKKPEE